MDKQFLNEINSAYYRLELKQAEIVHALFHRIFELESGWYSGHYHKGDNGNWFRESYPIPVIGVKGFCDIEIQFDKISEPFPKKWTRKMRKKQNEANRSE